MSRFIGKLVLWDLAGQPAYRLVHQLSMEDAALACVLFDCRNETNPFESAASRSQVLDQARTRARSSRRSSSPHVSTLVASPRAGGSGSRPSPPRERLCEAVHPHKSMPGPTFRRAAGGHPRRDSFRRRCPR